MKTARLVVLGTAALAGIGAFLLIISGTKQPAPVRIAVPAAPRMDEVLVAAKEVPFGYMLKDGDLRWQSWPKNGAPPEAILRAREPKAKQQFAGWLVRSRLSAGEPINKNLLIQPGKAGFLAALLPEGMRAVAIPVETSGGTTAGNFILPGDHVDVIHTYKDDEVARATGGDGMVSETILHNVRVLAIGQNIQKSGDKPFVEGSNATLELAPKQVEELMRAQRVGQLSLSLRSMADSKTVSREVPDKDASLTIVRFGIAAPGPAR